jgi:acetyl esterase/lipase
MIKLFFALLLLLASLLIVFPAPNSFLWKVAVGLTNFPYVPMLLALVLLFVGVKSSKFGIPISVISIISFIVFSLPIIEALKKKSDLVELKKIFLVKDESSLPPVFSFTKMFGGNEKVDHEKITYKSIGAKDLTLDFYKSQLKLNFSPLIIVIHGGSWQSGDNKQLPELNSYLAAKGYNVAAINYRLAPAYKAPAPVEDTKDAIQFLISHAAEYNIDTNNIILLGRSAGAQVALCAAYNFHMPNIKGVVSYYGPADMVWAGQLPTNAGVLDNNEIYNNYLGGLYKDVPEKFKEVSAVQQADSSSPPTLMIHGKIDPLVFHIHPEHLQKRLNELKVLNYYLEFNYATHGCDYSIKSPAGQVGTYAIMRFLQSVIKKGK